MNNINKTLSVLLLFIGTLTISAQDNRTLDTKVADILAQLPTGDLEHSDRLMQEIIGLGESGILKFTDMLVPLGTGNDTKARYAVQSVAVYSGGSNAQIQNGIVENTLLKALEKASDKEVKTFLMERLQYVGTNASVAVLSSYLGNNALFEPALATLTAIGTEAAGKSILEASQGADANRLAAFVDALGVLRFAPAQEALAQALASPSQT
ncbi:MAG TPA: hypothetical protein VLZ54_07665 [Arenibacter sp.]|nr:hypothetical protein [Arenibacter sp.]